MKNNLLSTFIKICKVLVWPILFGIGQIFICGLFVVLCSTKNSDEITNEMFTEYINHNMLWILLVECIIFIPIFYRAYKKYCIEKEQYDIKCVIQIILFSSFLSFILNLMIITLKHICKVPITVDSIQISIILSTGIVGPILEEFLFRGIVYGKLSSMFSQKSSFWISIILFAFSHSGIYQIFFAFIIGYVLTYIYQRYHDIKFSMVAHIMVNITSILVAPMIVSIW